MNSKWFVIANSVEAKIYYTDNMNTELTLHHTLTHPDSRKKGSELNSDRPGHYQSRGDGHGAFVAKHDPKETEAERFASEIGNYLCDAHHKNAYQELVIAASPPFHGLLNKQLNSHLTDVVIEHIEKDLTHIDMHKIDKTVREYMHVSLP